MRELGIIRDGALAIRAGKIVAVGKTHDITKAYRGEYILSAKGKTVLPGFVDPHTHLVFAGSQEDEFQMKVEGASFAELLDSGGSMLKTAKETRNTRTEKLVDLGLERLDTMLAHGTTTLEAKSGYGLTTDGELKILNVAKRLNQLHCAGVVSTYMGAHAVPLDYRNNVDEFVNLIIEEGIPQVANSDLAEFCDVFCERGIFNLEQSKRILTAAKSIGLKPKMHADFMSAFGGAEAAAAVGSVSADHLNYASSVGIKAMAEKSVIAVLLPAATFSQMIDKYANARHMINSGVAVALGSGFNSSLYLPNQQLSIAMACHFMRLVPAEAITAATINAAHAVCRAGEVGSLEVGKQADVLVLNAPNHKFLGYSVGVNLVEKVICDGRLVVDREKQDEPMLLSRAD